MFSRESSLVPNGETIHVSEMVAQKISEFTDLIKNETSSVTPQNVEEVRIGVRATLAKEIANVLTAFKTSDQSAEEAQAYLAAVADLAESEGYVYIGDDVRVVIAEGGDVDGVIDPLDLKKISVDDYERVRDDLGRVVPDWENVAKIFKELDIVEEGVKEFFELMGEARRQEGTDEQERTIEKIVTLSFRILTAAQDRAVKNANRHYQSLEKSLPDRTPREKEAKEAKLREVSTKIHDLESARVLPLPDPAARFIYDYLRHETHILDKVSRVFQTEGQKPHA